jgi:WD40 repeat protein
MSQPEPEQPSQRQENIVQGIQFGDGGGTLNFNPVLIGTQIETQIIQIATEKVTQRELIKASPYKGLKRFNFADRDRFFGRDALIKRLLKAVNQSSLSLVLGASGSGKSSVVRAGVIPELKKSLQAMKFYDFIFTPGKDPFESLHRCLLSSEEKDYRFSESEVEIVREQRSETLSRAIQKLKKEEERWLFFVDQFEELFTNCGDPEIRQSFIDGIVQIAEAKDSSVRIVLAMRSDFLEQFSSYPALGEILNQNNIHLVTDMHPDELRQAIEQPAAKHGVVFEEGLVEQVVKDVQGQSGYLPLLQYTLDLLWESECLELAADGRPNIEDRILNWSTYNALEGVRGALQKRVNQIYQSQDQDGQIATKQIFLRLVNIVDTESGSRAVSRRAYRSEFVGESIEKTLTTFINENLLVSGYEYLSEGDLLISGVSIRRQHATVELAHEVLLSSWDALRRWLEEEKEAIILKNWLADETRRWQRIRVEDESRAKDELLKGARLAQVVAFRERNAFKKLGGLSPEENQYIDASVEWRDFRVRQEEERKQREIRQARRIAIGSGVAAIIMAGLAGLAGIQLRRAEVEQIRTYLTLSESRRLANEGLQARIESLKAGITFQKSIWQRFFPVSGLEDQVLNQLQKTLFGFRESNNLVGHQGSVNKVIFNTQRNVMATSSEDGVARVWDREGKLLAELKVHQGWISDIEFNANGDKVATSSADGTAQIWDLQGNQLAELKGHEGIIWNVTFSPDGNQIATSGEDGTARLWNLQGEQLAVLKGHQGPVWEILFNQEGTIATRGSDGIVRLWNLQGQQQAELKGHQGAVWDIAFNSAGTSLVTCGEDKTIRVWDLQGTQLEEFEVSQSAFNKVIFSPDGNKLALRTLDGRISLWNFQTDEQLDFKDHPGRVWDMAFSPESTELVTLSEDGVARLWDLAGNEIRNFKGHIGRVWSVAFSPDGIQLATSGEDAVVRLWDLRNNWLAEIEAEQMLLSPDKTKLATIKPREVNVVDGNTVKDDYMLELWDLNGKQIANLPLPSPPSWEALFFFPDSTHLLFRLQRSDDSYNSQPFLWNLEDKQITELSGEMSSFDYDATGKNLHDELSSDGALLATFKEDIVYLSHLRERRISEIRTSQGKISDIALSPNKQFLFTVHEGGKAHLWNLRGEHLAELAPSQATLDTQISKGVISPNSRYIATSDGDNLVQIWNIEGKLLASFNSRHDGQVYLSFTPDNSALVTAGWGEGGAIGDRLARLWDLQGNQLAELLEKDKQTWEQLTAVVFSPDGKWLIVGDSDGTIKLWDFEGNLLGQIEDIPGSTLSLKFSPDGTEIATFGVDNIARIWDVHNKESPKLQLQLTEHQGVVTDVEFSSDKQRLMTNSDDGKVRVWDFQGNLLTILQDERVYRYLTSLDVSKDGNQLIVMNSDFEGGSVKIWQIGSIDPLLSSLCSLLSDYLKNSQSVASQDRNLCQGIGQAQQ